MGICKYHGVCGLEDANQPDGYLCVCDALRFIEADLSRCRFLGTDVRKVGFIGVLWVQIGSRDGICDEIEPSGPGKEHPLALTEELYRQLKQNYEERRDYERAGHFHVGEKEMRLRNPATRLDLRILLALYKGISGYGENYRRPLFWLLVLLLLTSATALVHGLSIKGVYSVRVWPGGLKLGGSLRASPNCFVWLRTSSAPQALTLRTFR
jgi:hypothetical protein